MYYKLNAATLYWEVQLPHDAKTALFYFWNSFIKSLSILILVGIQILYYFIIILILYYFLWYTNSLFKIKYREPA